MLIYKPLRFMDLNERHQERFLKLYEEIDPVYLIPVADISGGDCVFSLLAFLLTEIRNRRNYSTPEENDRSLWRRVKRLREELIKQYA